MYHLLVIFFIIKDGYDDWKIEVQVFLTLKAQISTFVDLKT
jgi:hypothetical protein